MNTILAVHEFNHAYLLELAEPISDAALDARPAPRINTPAWILGHLAIAFELSSSRLGLPPMLPEDWTKTYGPGSTGSAPNHPGKAALLDRLEACRRRLLDAYQAAPQSLLDALHPVEFFHTTPVNTIGKAVANILTGHYCTHIGQLTVWRRLSGFDPIF